MKALVKFSLSFFIIGLLISSYGFAQDANTGIDQNSASTRGKLTANSSDNHSEKYAALEAKYAALEKAYSDLKIKDLSRGMVELEKVAENLKRLKDANEKMKNQNFGLSVGVLFALVITLALMQFALHKQKKQLSDDTQVKIFALSLIILGSIYLVTAGFDKEQINPVLTIFGTVAGYLLATKGAVVDKTPSIEPENEKERK